MEHKKSPLDWLLKYDMKNVMLVVLMLVIISMLFIFLGSSKQANQCLANPLVYGVQKGQVDYDPNDGYASATGKMFCSCTFENPAYRPIYFDNETISTYDLQREEINETAFVLGLLEIEK